MVHAKILPQWRITKAESLAREASLTARQKIRQILLPKMYGNKPAAWDEAFERLCLPALHRQRLPRGCALTFENELDFDYKSTVKKMPPYLRPWFKAPTGENLDCTIIFGHWSSLGYTNADNVISLDTYALWGGQLTAVNLETEEITHVYGHRLEKASQNNGPPHYAQKSCPSPTSPLTGYAVFLILLIPAALLRLSDGVHRLRHHRDCHLSPLASSGSPPSGSGANCARATALPSSWCCGWRLPLWLRCRCTCISRIWALPTHFLNRCRDWPPPTRPSSSTSTGSPLRQPLAAYAQLAGRWASSSLPSPSCLCSA